jgi:hypothetical protein
MPSTVEHTPTHVYDAFAHRDGRWWSFSIPQLNGPSPVGADVRIEAMGQARTLRELRGAAREVAALWLDVDETAVEVRVHLRRRWS